MANKEVAEPNKVTKNMRQWRENNAKGGLVFVSAYITQESMEGLKKKKEEMGLKNLGQAIDRFTGGWRDG